MVVVHLDELVEIDAVEIEDAAEVVSEDEVVAQLDHSLDVVRITLLQQEQQLRLDGCLIVILLLVLDQFDRYELLVLVVEAFDDLAEGTLSNDLDELEPERNVVALLDPVVAFLVVEAVVDESLHVARLDLEFVFTEVVDLVILLDFLFLEGGQVLVGDVVRLCHRGRDWKLYLHV